ncbi:MAG: MBL fold metallo-hydrolase [Firmicutes bacterium]|nr:MBL fold metallo-hydrolase [Bacillota bacterium]
MASLLYQGHGSIRITTTEGKVIYIDPYVGEGYNVPADAILQTHQHSDHSQLNLIKSRNLACRVITEAEAIKDGIHQQFDLGYVKLEAVEAGNKNHDPQECVGYILTLSDGVKLYFSGDTSKTAQMETMAKRELDYAFLCCDGIYNMDLEEAAACAAIIKARYSIPYHMSPGQLFERGRAEQFQAPGKLIIADGEEIILQKKLF